MEIIWKIEQHEIKELQAFVRAQSSDPFVRNRFEINVKNPPSSVSVDEFWQVMVGCLLTSQQRSGPDSHVTRFLLTRPFPLSYAFYQETREPEEAGKRILQDFGGIRFTSKIASHLAQNYAAMERGLRQDTGRALQHLISRRTPEAERETAAFIRENYMGFGPKQSRNLLQGLRLTRFEIPVDSRIVRWLNEFGFPVPLSAAALSDPDYYDFVSDGIQAICRQSDLFPCVLDAAIFSSFDAGGWTDENVVW